MNAISEFLSLATCRCFLEYTLAAAVRVGSGPPRGHNLAAAPVCVSLVLFVEVCSM